MTKSWSGDDLSKASDANPEDPFHAAVVVKVIDICIRADSSESTRGSFEYYTRNGIVSLATAGLTIARRTIARRTLSRAIVPVLMIISREEASANYN